MKKFILALTALFVMAVSANAMSYEQARQQALFLTDKMAYELNLTEQQYEAAYEINLDYLMSVNSQADLYGAYWQQRNLDLSYILLDWQYRLYLDASYFYRPLYWNAGYWHFGIYARYPRRDYFYFGRPHFYPVYRGGHSWRMNGGRSWYHGRDFGHRTGRERIGMRDGFNRGSFGNSGANRIGSQNNNPGNRSSFGNGGSRSFGNNSAPRESSTRSTVTTPRSNNNNSNVFGGSRSNVQSTPRSTFTPRGNTSSSSSPRSYSVPSRSGSSIGGGSSSFGGGGRGGSFSGGARSGGSSGGGRSSGGGGSFGARR